MAFSISTKDSTPVAKHGFSVPVSTVDNRRILSVRERVADLSPKMFESLVERGRRQLKLESETGKIEPPRTLKIVPDALDGELYLDAVADWKFMLSLNKMVHRTGDATLSVVGAEQPATLLSNDCFLPIGFAFDSAGNEELHILMRSSANTQRSPYLEHGLYNNVQNFLDLFERTRRPLRLVFVWTPQDILNRVINHVYFNQPIMPRDSDGSAIATATGPLSIDVQAGDDEIIKQARLWIRESIFRHASDIHIEPMEGRGRIRVRVHGVMEYLARDIPLGVLSQFVTWIKAQSNMDISDNRRPLDGSIRLSYTDSGQLHVVDIRISSIPVVYGQKMVLRILDADMLGKLASQGLDGAILDKVLLHRFKSALATRDGIVLVTGPTGSGKTTTLNISLLHLLRPDVFGDTKNIVTIEDPVEYSIPGANQTQVNDAAGVTFARTLRSLLRQDPDIVLIGEIRDSETAQIAVQASLTGHLILATLHTNDALGSVSRLQDLGISPFLIGSTLRLVQAQRLVRKFCDDCGRRPDHLLSREEVERKVSATHYSGYADVLTAEGATVYEPAGCVRCNGTGFGGRLAVMEMAVSSPELVRAIEQRVSSRELTEIATRYSGYRPMIANAVDFVAQGRTSLAEVSSISLKDIATEE